MDRSQSNERRKLAAEIQARRYLNVGKRSFIHVYDLLFAYRQEMDGCRRLSELTD